MKVLISTGGTGGHIFPALQTGIELKKRGHTVIFAGALSMSADKIRSNGFETIVIESKGLTDKSILGCFRFVRQMLHSLALGLKEVERLKPDKVIGFGGYGSFSILCAAWLNGFPTMLHEQNVIPGKANKILGGCVDKVAVSFKETVFEFGARTVWTGCPCNNVESSSREAIRNNLGLKEGSKVVVLLGGSQGSKTLNTVFAEAVRTLIKDQLVDVVHITGKNDRAMYEEKYKADHLSVIVKEFISPIEDIYKIADVVVSRSGAATVSELGFFGIQSILVPYPFAHGHQLYNARVLSHAGSAVIIEQKDLTVPVLINGIQSYLKKSITKEILAKKNEPFFHKDAVHRLANEVETL